MTKELIEDFRKIILPFVCKKLSAINYEGLGKLDAEEFEKDFNEILDLAAKALEQETRNKDCVSRQAAIDAVNNLTYPSSLVDVKRKLVDLPPVTPQPKMGHWINIEDRTDWYDATYKCSCCGREITTPYELKNDLYNDYPYCHCGARMIESRAESEE